MTTSRHSWCSLYALHEWNSNIGNARLNFYVVAEEGFKKVLIKKDHLKVVFSRKVGMPKLCKYICLPLNWTSLLWGSPEVTHWNVSIIYSCFWDVICCWRHWCAWTPCCLSTVEKWQNSLDYSLDYSTNLFIYSLNALPVSPWACFSPAIAPSYLPTSIRTFSVPVCCIRKMLLAVFKAKLDGALGNLV